MAISDKIDKHNFFSRIVFKFPDSFYLNLSDEKEINELFFKDNILSWKRLLVQFPGINVNRVFTSLIADEIKKIVKKAKALDPGYLSFDFLSCFAINCPLNIDVTQLLDILQKDKSIEWAYLQKNPGVPPSFHFSHPLHNYQKYLDAAPLGIDARYAWQQEGGTGGGNIKFIDIEQGWLMQHEDLRFNTLPCTGISHYFFEDHGAAVLGVIMMRNINGNAGGAGITPQANGFVVSQWRPDGSFNTDDAMMTAIAQLCFGDILLIEAQVADPSTVRKLWPVETEKISHEVIRLATALGISVIEPAGNGNLGYIWGNDMDEFEIKGKKFLCPNSPDFTESGAIVVAASSSSLPHRRMKFSNYGTRVNCYSWGENVVTSGSYPRYSGLVSNAYTTIFGGTSSAAAIITGAAIAVQSMMEAQNGLRFNPSQLRAILSNELYGTTSMNGHSIDKIGVMPDLKKVADLIKANKTVK